MGSPLPKGSTKAEASSFIVGIALFLAIFLPFDDAVSNAKYSARNVGCQSNLHQLGLAVLSYRSAHQNQMPPNLKALLPVSGSQSVLECSLSDTDPAPPYTRRSYTYRFLIQPAGDDIICWDSNPHQPDHSVFIWLNRECRNVLYVDGRVGTISESEFERQGLRQGLRGVSLIL